MCIMLRWCWLPVSCHLMWINIDSFRIQFCLWLVIMLMLLINMNVMMMNMLIQYYDGGCCAKGSYLHKHFFELPQSTQWSGVRCIWNAFVIPNLHSSFCWKFEEESSAWEILPSLSHGYFLFITCIGNIHKSPIMNWWVPETAQLPFPQTSCRCCYFLFQRDPPKNASGRFDVFFSRLWGTSIFYVDEALSKAHRFCHHGACWWFFHWQRYFNDS